MVVAEPAEEVKEKPKRLVRNKVRSTVPTEGVDLAMGDGPLEGADPITDVQVGLREIRQCTCPEMEGAGGRGGGS